MHMVRHDNELVHCEVSRAHVFAQDADEKVRHAVGLEESSTLSSFRGHEEGS
ncbi:MAG: hypothetical protein WBE76_17550 [Terracidiphilus sp.]